MKKTIFILAIIGFTACAILFSCNKYREEKVENAQEEVMEARHDLTQAQIEERNENFKAWQEFRNESEQKIRDNEDRISKYVERMKKSGKKMEAKYEEKINQLEQKNKDLRIKMENYKEGDNQKWDEFKREFNHDMNELGKALKDLTVDNEK